MKGAETMSIRQKALLEKIIPVLEESFLSHQFVLKRKKYFESFDKFENIDQYEIRW